MAMINPVSRKQKAVSRGFTLLIAVIFMSVMLSFGLALASLGYKQLVLSSGAVGSQYAFYAADAALECVLYYDQQRNLFAFPQSNPNAAPASILCNNLPPSTSSQVSYSAALWVVKYSFQLNSNRCADVTVYKYSAVTNDLTTYIFSQGYDVACSAVGNSTRSVSRGINAHY